MEEVIWFLLHTTKIFPSLAEILLDTSHSFLPSVSLHNNLVIISGGKSLKFSLSLIIFDMPMSPFLSHIPASALDCSVLWFPDRNHHSTCHWSKVVRGEESKKERKYLEGVWFGKLFKDSYLISHNLLSVTDVFQQNLHSNGVKWRLLSLLPNPLRTSFSATFTSFYSYRNTRRDQNRHAWQLCFNSVYKTPFF